MILVIDNYDSFVETLARYCREWGAPTRLVRNDALSVAEALSLAPRGIILSPGPGRPAGAGLCLDLIKAAPTVPLLGVCLGHQAVAEAYGGQTVQAGTPCHGQASDIYHTGQPAALWAGIPSPFAAGRYHSLMGVAPPSGALVPMATLADGTPMAFAHRALPHFGVQFHPESLLTPHGHRLVGNFVALTRAHDPDWGPQAHKADTFSPTDPLKAQP